MKALAPQEFDRLKLTAKLTVATLGRNMGAYESQQNTLMAIKDSLELGLEDGEICLIFEALVILETLVGDQPNRN